MEKTATQYQLLVASRTDISERVTVVVENKDNVVITIPHAHKSIDEHIYFYESLAKELRKNKQTLEK